MRGPAQPDSWSRAEGDRRVAPSAERNLEPIAGVLAGVLPATGSEVWNYGNGAATIPSGAAAGDSLYIPSNGLTALKPAADGGDTQPLWTESAQNPGTSSPLVIGDRVYIVNNAGVLNCASRETGERLWRARLKGPFSGSPVACGNGHLYLFNEQGLGQCVDLSDPEGKVVSEIDLKETILGTASISGDALYVRSDGHLWKIGG